MKKYNKSLLEQINNKLTYQTQIEDIFKRSAQDSAQLEAYVKAYEDILLKVQDLVTVDDSLGQNLLKVTGHSQALKDFSMQHPSVSGGDLNAMIGAVAKAYFQDAYLPDTNALRKVAATAVSNKPVPQAPVYKSELDMSDEEYEERYADRIPYRPGRLRF